MTKSRGFDGRPPSERSRRRDHVVLVMVVGEDLAVRSGIAEGCCRVQMVGVLTGTGGRHLYEVNCREGGREGKLSSV